MIPTQSLAWGARVSPAFRRRLYELVANLGWHEEQASDLMAVMAFETGRTFSPSVSNPLSSATGLIQFMDATARGMGTSTAKLARMSAVEQLSWVEEYFRHNAKRIRTLEDMYMAVLWPRGIGRALEYTLWKIGAHAYAVNKGLDANRDGRVSKREASAAVFRQLNAGLRPENRWAPDPQPLASVMPALDPFADEPPAVEVNTLEGGRYAMSVCPRPAPEPAPASDFGLWLGGHW